MHAAKEVALLLAWQHSSSTNGGTQTESKAQVPSGGAGCGLATPGDADPLLRHYHP